jgi:hypothetical protein
VAVFYFKVNICPFPLPHFASIFFAYLWSFRWPNDIVTLPRYFSLMKQVPVDSSPCLQIIKLEDKDGWSVFELRIVTYSSSSPLFLWKLFHKPIVLVVLTTANFGGFSNFCRYYARSQTTGTCFIQKLP